MTGHKRRSATHLSLNSVNIAVANGGGADTHLYLALLGRVDIHLFHHQGFTEFVTNGSFHHNLLKPVIHRQLK